MLDITIIREEPDRVKQAMRDLNDDEALSRIDLIIELDEKRRALTTEVDEMRAQKNAASNGGREIRIVENDIGTSVVKELSFRFA